MAEEAGGTTEPGTSRSGGSRPGDAGEASGGRVPPSSGPRTGADWAQRPEGYRPRLVRRICAAVLGALLVGTLAWVALRSPTGQALDTVLMESVMSWDGALGRLGVVVTGLVSLEASVVVAAVVVVVALLRRRPTLAGRALGIAIGANASTQLLKAALDRPDLGVSTVLENSLPSGHVTFAASVSLALVVVAPEWFRTPAAWLGWLWTSLMGITVMVYAWHRPADVIAAVAVAGTWALALAPVEHRGRHGTVMRRTMGVIALVLVLLAALGITVALAGSDLPAQAMPGATEFGFSTFLHAHPWRERLLALCCAGMVTGVVGVVVHEVDRLSWS